MNAGLLIFTRWSLDRSCTFRPGAKNTIIRDRAFRFALVRPFDLSPIGARLWRFTAAAKIAADSTQENVALVIFARQAVRNVTMNLVLSLFAYLPSVLGNDVIMTGFVLVLAMSIMLMMIVLITFNRVVN